MFLLMILCSLLVTAAYNGLDAVLLTLMRLRLCRDTPHITEFERLEKPETVEEAKCILLRSREDDYSIACRQMKLARVWAIVLIAVVAGIVGAIAWHGMEAFFSSLLLFACPVFCLYMDYRQFDKITEALEGGIYFYYASDEELLEKASQYADEYNRFEQSLGREPVAPGTLPEESWKSPWLNKIDRRARRMERRAESFDRTVELLTSGYVNTQDDSAKK